MRPPASPGPFQEGSDAKRARENVIYTIVMVIGLVLQSSRMPSGQIFKGSRRMFNCFFLRFWPGGMREAIEYGGLACEPRPC